MPEFLRTRSPSLSMVVLVLLFIAVMQEGISYTITFGTLDVYIPIMRDNPVAIGWLGLRGLLIMVAIGLWVLNRKRQ